MVWLCFRVVPVTRFTALKCMTSGTEKSRYPLLLRDAVAQTVSRWYRAIEAIKFFCYMVPILSWCFELICIEQFCFSLTPRCGGVLKYQHQLSVSLMSVSWNHTAIVIDPTSLRWLKLFILQSFMPDDCSFALLTKESRKSPGTTPPSVVAQQWLLTRKRRRSTSLWPTP